MCEGRNNICCCCCLLHQCLPTYRIKDFVPQAILKCELSRQETSSSILKRIPENLFLIYSKEDTKPPDRNPKGSVIMPYNHGEHKQNISTRKILRRDL